MAENLATTNDELQSQFDVYDTCSSKSTWTFLMSIEFITNNSGYDDECVTAAELYGCGRQNSPVTATSIVNSLKGDAAVVSLLLIYAYM